mgnify:CR=1 FL=1
MGKGIREAAGNIARAVTRTTAFLRKDIVDFVRQPRLVLALVLGPFLILLLFGLGFKSEPIALRTIIVIGEDNPLRSYVEENADTLVRQLVLVDIVESESYARHQLINNRVDVVIVVPDTVEQKIRSNEQAVFVTLYNTIDPMQTNYVRAFTNVYVSEVNRRAHLMAVREAQQETGEVEPEIEAAREDAANLRQAMERGDEEAAREELLQLRRTLAVVQTALGPSEWLLIGSGELLSGSGGGGQENEPKDLLAESLENLDALSQTESDQLDTQESLEKAAQLEEDLGQLETAMEDFRSADPNVIVSPFVGENRTVGRSETDLSDYYVPGTIAMLLQHLCITLGALSFVRERQTGAMELFQTSPLAAIEVLVGKYVAYWLAAALAASALTGLLLLVLQVPMMGSWWEYAGTLAALMFTSLGVGFLISIAARSISQAVQYSMIALLASVFFSGFFLSLDLLRWFVRLVSWIIPASYGIRLLQDIMLRGLSFQVWEVTILAGMGLVLFIVAWLGLRRELART